MKEKIIRFDYEEPTASHPRCEKPESLSWMSNLYSEHEADEERVHRTVRGAEARSNWDEEDCRNSHCCKIREKPVHHCQAKLPKIELEYFSGNAS